jgi:hypothetical protein
MHAGHGKDDAMQLSNLSGVGTSDKQFRVGVAFATAKIKWLLAWHNMARVRYFKIKWNRDNTYIISHIFHMLHIGGNAN